MTGIEIDGYGRLTNLEKQLGARLVEVENPSRYVGSEYILGEKAYQEGMIKCAICFPDLYEIGMSNNAIRIIYDLLNRKRNIICDRVFSVAPDFESLLREKSVPLFTLQQRFALNRLDFLGISIGYELSATDILQVLDLGGLSIDVNDRRESDPVVIAGGPAATNPLPFSRFVDFVYIGEAENGLAEVVEELGKYSLRSERIEALKAFPFLWYPGKQKAKRAVDNTFGTEDESPVLEHFVVPSFQVAQDHGTVEIMRGCPNGCRFCHAGQYYKPFRQRNLNTVYDLVRQSVNELGYREVTLSSLSSGDYPDLDSLMKSLNRSFSSRNISFSLPSLKVSSFSLGILEQLSEVRKSGLTFAIETPMLMNQRSMNKEVPVEQVIEIIQEARNRGWKLAKFYFMVGLPFVDMKTEQENIVSFLSKIRTATRINMNINIGTFIPKAHTPFQWVKQLSMEESEQHLKSIKRALMAAIPGIKVSYHEPSISFLEGILSRGDEKCASLIEKAYSLGCRLDAWDEYIRWDLWQQAIAETGYDTSFRAYGLDEELPWDSVSLNVSKAYLRKEYERAASSLLTSTCCDSCDHNCGVCGKNASSVRKADNTSFDDGYSEIPELPEPESYVQTVFSYSKSGKAVFCSHIAVMRQFEMAFQRSGLSVRFTEGFNPKPRLEFLNPVSLGVSGDNELLLCELPVSQATEEAVALLNSNLAEGFVVKSIRALKPKKSGKKVSLASHFQGSLFEFSDIADPEISFCLDKAMLAESNDFKVRKPDDNTYTVRVYGEKNLFKLIFPETLSKFHIAGSCILCRRAIYMEDL